MKLKRIRRFALLLIALTIAFGAGWKARGHRPSAYFNPQSSQLEFSSSPLFNQVYQVLRNSFLEKEKLSDQKKLLYGSIEGMVASLGDPYTTFLAPKDTQKFEEDMAGAFGGVGIELGYKKGQLAVIAPLEDTPAEQAGAKAGDLIIHIKDAKKDIDRDTGDLTLMEAVEIIRGPIGDPVQLTLLREEEPKPIKVSITRQEITIPRVTLEMLEKNDQKLAHLKLARFGGNTNEQWDEHIRTIVREQQAANFGGIILDMRNNPGGYLDGAIYVASEFITDGVIVQQESRQQQTETFSVDRQGKLIDTPLVVLVNQGSASAAEIVAGALKEQRGTTIIGQTTFGKGTIQQTKELPNKASLHITIARWLLPSGKEIHDQGIQPDTSVKDDPTTEKVDEQLQKAIEQLLKQN